VLALEYLARLHIAHRDLKQENLLLDHTNGYLKLADFGHAKRVLPGELTYSFAGTPDYIAPEVVRRAGHNRAVDWWALGVVLFDVVTGRPPFARDPRSVAELAGLLAADVPDVPHFSEGLASFLRGLLDPRPALRLGAGGSMPVRRHVWFEGFDWAQLEQRHMPAPSVPEVADPGDVSNFLPWGLVDGPPAADGDGEEQRKPSYGAFDEF